MKIVIKRVWRCTWRLHSSELRDAFGGRQWDSLDMHLKAELSDLTDAFGGRDRVSVEMHLKAVIERVWRST